MSYISINCLQLKCSLKNKYRNKTLFGLCPPMCGKAAPFRIFRPAFCGCAADLHGQLRVRQRWRRSRENGSNPDGKAQPFRTSGGRAAVIRLLRHLFFKEHRSEAIYKKPQGFDGKKFYERTLLASGTTANKLLI